MSDALTDINRDERKAEIVNKIRKLEQEPEKNKEEILKLADECDSIPRGYWTGQTKVREQVCKNFGW